MIRTAFLTENGSKPYRNSQLNGNNHSNCMVFVIWLVVLEHGFYDFPFGSCHHPSWRSLHRRFLRFSCSCCWAWLSDVSPSLETLGFQKGMRAKSMGICWQHLLPQKKSCPGRQPLMFGHVRKVFHRWKRGRLSYFPIEGVEAIRRIVIPATWMQGAFEHVVW